MAASNVSKALRPDGPDVDAVVAGAGFAGLYSIYRLRRLGFSVRAFEAAADVGGTWYWNRYPGARCDVPTTDYVYSFDRELESEFTWSEKYATQPEILRYAQHVADKYGLRRDIQFSTRIASATWDDDASLWHVRTDRGDEVSCRYLVMASGCLSAPKTPDIEGLGRFAGEVYYTSRWPHEGVDFTGKQVAVIGTGSSGVQAIPLIADQAARLTVFQRTPNFSIPAHNGPVRPEKRAPIEADRDAYREGARWSRAGIPMEEFAQSALQLSPDEQQARLQAAWDAGELFEMILVFNDVVFNPAANHVVAEFIRGKIRSIVADPETAEALCPTDHYFATKRPCLDTNYFATFNRPHVRLVDLRKHPISTITEKGIDTVDESFELDAIVFATGFDAMTGALVAVDVTGRDGLTLKEKWAHGPANYLGVTTAGFPNFFTITGPGSPSVLSNMMVSIEQHVDWVADCMAHLRERSFTAIEPTETAEAGWVAHVNDVANLSLFPTASSWYMGANVPGKPRVCLPYVGGLHVYRAACDEVVKAGYLGFRLGGPAGSQCNDGVVRRLQPDVALLLDTIAKMDLPRLETMSAADARAASAARSAQRPPGPAVGEVVDGVLTGARGELEYRLYRPPSKGPHPIVVYFHGGGWVLGSLDSNDPLCRDLCVRSDAVVVSVNYRHAPENRFPAAVDDGFAAVRWIAEHAAELGGVPGQLAVCGWSAGGNIATVACQRARDAGGPAIAGQVLLAPVTDCDLTRPSCVENGEGYILTTPLMKWFWDHYADPDDRTNPLASPLRARDLSHLPPALVVTCELDPLRDEGVAYAEALKAAGVPVRHLPARGQIHTSPLLVDIIVSGAPIRAEMAAALRQFFAAPALASQ
jgi:cation diffusion facilitator CzcD-associated flavoprotein CzcO/acetyl esterase/lipase